MKKTRLNLMLWSVAIMAALFASSCTEDEGDGGTTEDPVASFTFAIDESNPFQVTFTNNSLNATAYSWDFGDGSDASTEENPVHVYTADDQFTVTLTATNDGGGSSTFDATINITDPDAALTLLAGLSGESKKWILLREGTPLGVGPSAGDVSWWAFSGDALGDRPCVLDDEYTFTRDGLGFTNNTNGTFYMDDTSNGGWVEGIDAGCVDETTEGIFTSAGGHDMSALANGGEYTFDFNTSEMMLTVTGAGAYIGLANKANSGDLGTGNAPAEQMIYNVLNLVDGDGVDSLALALVGDGFAWNYYLVHYENESETPEIPAGLVGASFTPSIDGLTVTFNNTSKNATSFAWDFGDGNTSTEESPVHTYASAGDYTVSLTASDGTNEHTAEQTVTVGAAPVTEFNITFEDDAVFFDNLFGGSQWQIIDNPQSSGINTSGKVGELIHGNETWAGVGGSVGGFIDFTDKTSVSVMVYAPATGVLKFKIEDSADGQNTFTEFDADITVANEWTKITIPLESFTAGIGLQSGKFNTVVLFPGWNTTTADTYYIDNIVLE